MWQKYTDWENQLPCTIYNDEMRYMHNRRNGANTTKSYVFRGIKDQKPLK